MKSVSVNSSVMHMVQYDENKSTLTIAFHDGDLRTYRNVPREVYEAFLTNPSKGLFFNLNIRDQYAHN